MLEFKFEKTRLYSNIFMIIEVTDLGLNQFVSKWTKPNKTEEREEKNLHASASFDRMQVGLRRKLKLLHSQH